MRVFVTGIGGFIGSAISRRLLESGCEVGGLDNFRTGLHENVSPDVEFYEADIRDINALSKVPLKSFDAILHLAGQSSGEISHDDPDYDLETNARGTLNVLRVARDCGVRRILNASSMGVYGEVTPDACPLTEESPLNPLSFYGVSKLAAEKYCNYFVSQGIDITSFRMFNVYGPGQNLSNQKQGMVSIYLSYLLANEPIVVKGSLERFRDFIYIDDVVDAWVRAISDRRTFNRVFNLCTGQKTTVGKLIQSMTAAFETSFDNVRVSCGTAGDQSGLYGSRERLSSAIGWFPGVQVEEGIRRTLGVYRTKAKVTRRERG